MQQVLGEDDAWCYICTIILKYNATLINYYMNIKPNTHTCMGAQIYVRYTEIHDLDLPLCSA